MSANGWVIQTSLISGLIIRIWLKKYLLKMISVQGL